MKGEVILIAHNIRSAHNIGALFRTADGAGVSEIILSGYSPAPARKEKLVFTQAEKALKKTALGAEETLPWKKVASLNTLLKSLKNTGYEILALEQHEKSLDYRAWQPKGAPVALLLGNEVRGMDTRLLRKCDAVIEIPMRGKKNSLNVSVAAGIALYQITARIEGRE